MEINSGAETLFDGMKDTNDSDYLEIARSSNRVACRLFIDKLWIRFKPYADAKFKSQFKVNFLSRMWELWVGNFLLEEGFGLKTGGKSEWPDFHAWKNGHELLIEAICIGNADSPDAIGPLPQIEPSMTRGQYAAEFITVKLEPYELRYQRAIQEKYENYVGILTQMQLPYIIAVSGAKLPYGDCSFGEPIPSIIKALFPVGNEYLSVSDSNEVTMFREKRVFNLNHKGTRKTKEIFSSDKYSLISGLIFTAQKSINRDNLKDGLFLIRNPFATYPLIIIRPQTETGGC